MLPSDWSDIFSRAGQQYGVDPHILMAQATVESGGDPNAVSSTGARGPMQFMPETAKALGITDPTDPEQAIFGAAQLVRQNYDRYGDWDTALRAYHGGTNQKNWGPLTQAYPHKVRAAMDDNSITQQPLGDPNFQYFPDQGDGRGAFYINNVTGQLVPAQVGAGGGQSNFSSPLAAPDQTNDADPTQPDFSNLPPTGGARFQSPSGAAMGGPPQGLFTQGADGLSQGSILQDPAYKDIAMLKFAGGLASGNPATAGFGAGLSGIADTGSARLQNNVLMQRLTAMYGPKGMQIASSLIRSGMQPSAAFAAAGISLPPDLAQQMNLSSQSAKALPAGVQKLTNEGFDGIRQIRTTNATLEQLQQHLQNGDFSLDRAHQLWYQAEAALGNPTKNPAVTYYQQLQAAVATITGEKLKEQSGVQTDKDAELAKGALTGGGLTSTDQAIQHFNYIKNVGQLEEHGIRNNINQAYTSAKQPQPDYDALEKSLPGRAPLYDAKTISSDMYGNHMRPHQAQPNSGIGQPGVTSKGTKYTIIGQ